MSSNDRRATARRKAWGRGPTILRFEPLEGRQLLSTTPSTATPAHGPDLVATSFDTLHNLDQGDTFRAVGFLKNQGDKATSGSFTVDVYASAGQAVDSQSLYVGTITMNQVIAPGQSVKFDQSLTLPAMAVPNLGTAPSFYLNLVVDPSDSQHETNTANNAGNGQGVDTSLVTITPHQPSSLASSGFRLDSGSANWGGTVGVSATIQNKGPGDAPATRAIVVATPAGQTPGGANDVTLGSISVPGLPAYQSINVSGKIALPTSAPSRLAGATKFTLSLIQDADYQADPMGPHTSSGVIGTDAATLQITAATGGTTTPTTPTPAPRPDLAVASIQAPTAPLAWGENAQIGVTIQNRSATDDAGPYRVQFLLVDGANPAGPALVLADTTLSGLKANASQDLSQTVHLPAKLAGQTPPASSQGLILVKVDPEHTIDDTTPANNSLSSAVSLALVTRTPAPATASTSTDSTSTDSTTTTTDSTTSTPSTQTTTTSATSPTTTTTPTPTTSTSTGTKAQNAKAQARATTQATRHVQAQQTAHAAQTLGQPTPAGTARTKTIKVHQGAAATQGTHRKALITRLRTARHALKVVGKNDTTSTGA